jgi:sulfonate transport system substrate-binding protein
VRALAAALLICTAACGKASGSEVEPAQAQVTVRVGYQKSSALPILRWQKSLEPELARRGATVEWAEFTSGPALLEALRAERLDYGFVGEAPPIFAQAASDSMIYVGYEPAQPLAEAILVPSSSAIHSLAELRGRSVALNKGSNVHYFLAKALERAHVAYAEVKVVFLPPADARAAFEKGTVDAWAIWDPYLAAAEASTAARVLATADQIAPNHQFYVSRRAFVAEHPELLELLNQQVTKTDAWIVQHRPEVAALLAAQLNIDATASARATERAAFGFRSMDDEVLASQQRIADTFLALGLLQNPLWVRDAVPAHRP